MINAIKIESAVIILLVKALPPAFTGSVTITINVRRGVADREVRLNVEEVLS